MRRGKDLKRVIRVAVLLAAAVLLLSSCIEVNEKITMNADGSGLMNLNYQVARMVADLPGSSGSNQIVPLPTDPTQLQTAILSVPGLTLEGFTVNETSSTVGADAIVRFNALTTLDQVAGKFSPSGITYLSAGGLSTFTQSLYQGNPNGVSPETLQLVKRLFSDYRLTFAFQSSKPIQAVSIGTISADKMTASYTTTIPDIIQSKTPVVWEVSW